MLPRLAVLRADELRSERRLGEGTTIFTAKVNPLPPGYLVSVAHYEPGAQTPPHTNQGGEHHVVLTGTVDASYDGQRIDALRSGDYFYWDGRKEHAVTNSSAGNATVITVRLPLDEADTTAASNAPLQTVHPHTELVRRGYAAFAARDWDALRRVLHDDVTWHIPGRAPFAGVHHGRNAFVEVAQTMGRLSQGTLSTELLRVLADDEIGFALHRVTGERSGQRLDVRSVFRFHFRGGLVSEVWEHPHDLYEDDAFWVGE